MLSIQQSIPRNILLNSQQSACHYWRLEEKVLHSVLVTDQEFKTCVSKNHSTASLLDIHSVPSILYMLNKLSLFKFCNSYFIDVIGKNLKFKMTSDIQVGFDLNLEWHFIGCHAVILSYFEIIHGILYNYLDNLNNCAIH